MAGIYLRIKKMELQTFGYRILCSEFEDYRHIFSQ